ncbi:copper chaperone PCu(A)C [Burkholderiales bacterium]|nr:copper chaperone PCu(A)C [Burkholderiales bacterium]
MYRLVGLVCFLWSFLAFAGHHENIEHPDGMHVINAWVKEPLPGVDATAIYLSIHNPSNDADRLVSVSTDLAQISEIHEMLIVDDVMRMRRLDSGVPIAPDQFVKLEPGGLHIMLFELNKSFKVGETHTVILGFESAGEITVPVKVRAAADAAHHHQH